MKVKSHRYIKSLPGDASCHPHLTPERIYSVIGIDFDSYRIVNDKYEPVLYPKDMFDIVDPEYPSTWIKSVFDDGEYYIEPPEFSEAGFFEDYFDGVSEAVSVYNRYLDDNNLRRR